METYRLIQQIYLQKAQKEGLPLAPHENDPISYVIISDNHRSPDVTRSSQASAKRSRRQHPANKRKSTSKSKSKSSQSAPPNDHSKLLQEIRWQSICFGDQRQATAAVNSALLQQEPSVAQQENSELFTTTTAPANSAPKKPRRRASMTVECKPESPRRQASIAGQGLDGSNHSMLAATAA